MMSIQIPQFVPQEVCLKCEGCCRFKEQRSPWRPKVTEREASVLEKKGLSLLEKIFDGNVVDSDSYIKAINLKGGCQCSFFDSNSNTCRVYVDRPFECQFYPFLLEKREEAFLISVHLSCPHIQETEHNESFQLFVKELKELFSQPETHSFLFTHPELAGDYSEFADEIMPLFSLPIKSI